MVMQNVPGEIEDNSYATFVFLRERGGGGGINKVLYGLRQNADIVTSLWKTMMCICGSGGRWEQRTNKQTNDYSKTGVCSTQPVFIT